MNRIGLIAGNGRFPFLVADEIRRSGGEVVAVALNEETDPALASHVSTITWVPLGKLQGIIDAFHRENVTTAIMAGQVKHAKLFAGLSLDWRAVKLLGKLVNKKTDTILGAVADELAKEGITLRPSHEYLRHLIPGPGVLAGKKLSREVARDAEFGRTVARQIAGLDIGQTVAVKDRAVLAVESIEGTDECIRRAARYAGDGIVVVKVAKPNQDWRFDLPVIGPRTIRVMAEVKAKVLAVDSGATLFIDRNDVVKDAEANGITIVAL